VLAIPPFWASSKNALLRANTKPPVELVVADLDYYWFDNTEKPQYIPLCPYLLPYTFEEYFVLLV